MPLDDPVLRSRESRGKYGVQGLPTPITIDQQGKVAGVHVGDSPQLHEDVTTAATGCWRRRTPIDPIVRSS